MRVVEMIFYWARAVPHRLAIIQSEMVTTYQGLADAIESVSERVDRLNLNKREPVAVSIANPSFMLAAVFALLRNGYSVAPVNPPLYAHLAAAGISNLIYDTTGLALSRGRNIRFEMSWLPSAGQPTTARVYRKRPIQDANLIFFTSGTTGLPKKVVQPAAAIEQRLGHPITSGLAGHQNFLMMPGLTSAFAVNWTLELFNSGKTVCFAPDRREALSLIHLFRVEVVVGSPAQLLSLAEMKNANPGYGVDSLKAIFISGGKIAPGGLDRVRPSLCRNVINAYGSTEAGVVGLAPFNTLADTSSSMVVPWAEVEIVDEADRQLPPGAEGFVRTRSPQLMEHVKAAGPNEIPGTRGGWFYPGDVGSVDDEGVLHIAGRNTDVINRGGLKVSASRIETIVKELPEIADAAACGVVGSSTLEEIWIAVVANGDIDVEGVKRSLRAHGDVGVAPDEVFIVDYIPRTDLGKVQRYRLKELLVSLKQGAQYLD